MEDTHDLSAQMTILHERVHQWVDRLQSDGAEPEAFREAVGDLRAAVDGVGRAAFLQLVEACEVFDETLIGDGQVYRFKQTPDKVHGARVRADDDVPGRPLGSGRGRGESVGSVAREPLADSDS